MSANNTLNRRLTAGILAQDPQDRADPVALAEEAGRTWEEMARQLHPIIGEGGFRALYTRGLHLTRSKYPWLAVIRESEQTNSLFTGLKLSLQRREFAEARDASIALVVTFTELLETLIGDSLTERLLRSVRADDSPGFAQETRK